MNGELDFGIAEMFFSTKKRLNRLRYFKRTLALGLIFLGISLSLGMLSPDTSAEEVSLVGLLLYLVIAAAILVSTIMLSIRRLHDINMSGWLVLLSLIPFVDAIFQLFLLFKKGTDGDNDYGPDPLKI